MFQFVCPEDDGLQQDWFYNPQRQMFVRCGRNEPKVHRRIYGKYLADPDYIRATHNREPSKATQAMWDFWQKVKGGECQPQLQT